jgi:hypothetical protein
MAGQLSRRALRTSRWAAVLLGAMLSAALAAAAQPLDQSAPQDVHPLQQVQVTASKLDRHTLKLVAIQFVKLHGAVSPLIHQIGRWRADVCPKVTGLNPRADAFVSRRVQEVARSVGAPTRGVGKGCAVNVEIVFTPEPQQLLNHIAKSYPMLLGSSRSAGDTTFRHAIQSWYLTGTRVVNGVNPPDPSFGNANSMKGQSAGADIVRDADMLITGPSSLPFTSGLTVDVPGSSGTAATGLAGSYFTNGLASEFVHVFVVVDTSKVAGDSLQSVSDYIAMLALTRMSSLDGCNELPSIIDLLSSGCGSHAKPQALTGADTAYLKALYSADLDMNLNIELGDMRDRMVTAIAGR